MPTPLITPDWANNPFSSLMMAQANPAQELRFDDVEGSYLYHGRAISGAATSATVWEVVRFTRDADGLFERAQYQTGISWDNRANGWPA